MSVLTRNNIVTNGLVLYLDSLNPQSYTSGSLTMKDISKPNISSSWSNGIPDLQNGNLILNTGPNLIPVPGVSQSAFPLLSGSISIWVNAIYGIEQGGGGKGYFDAYDPSRNLIFIRSANGLNQIALMISGSPSYNAVFNHNSPQPNTWYNYVVTYTTGTTRNFKVYINGTLSANITPNSATWVPDGQFPGYGSYVSPGNTMSGSYGPLLIYNKDLSQAEVLQNYNATKTRFGLT